MALASIVDATIGSVITFRSKNPNDPVVWEGTLEGFGSYKVIQSYTNPTAYNQAVIQVDPTVSSDVTTLTYFLITVTNNASIPTTEVFANEWIEAGSLNEVSLGTTVTVSVSDPFNNPQAIISLLASANYASKIIPNP